jgi:predicted nucleic acid-binding protein
VTPAQFLIDTSALTRLLRPGAESFGWDQAAAAGLIAVCPIIELEFFYSARSPADREQGIQDLQSLFGWVPVHDRAFARAWDVQGELTSQGQHRSAGPVDLVVAATAELHGLTLLHHDRDFDLVARVTGQPIRWYGSDLSTSCDYAYRLVAPLFDGQASSRPLAGAQRALICAC